MPGVDTGSVEYRNQAFEMGLTLAQPRHLAARERLMKELKLGGGSGEGGGA